MAELDDFQYFKQHQLESVDFLTGVINVKVNGKTPQGKSIKIIRNDVGSKNQDGYIRVWCNQTLRMKHRLLFWLYYGVLPNEIDHIDRVRDNNKISNLRSVNRKQQLTNIGKMKRKRFKFTPQSLHTVCMLIKQGVNDTQIAKQIGCSRTAIMGIRTKYRHKDFSDKYF